MANPTPQEINRGHQQINIAAPSTSGNPVSVPNLQAPNLRNPFWKGVDQSTVKWFQSLFSRISSQTANFENTRANRVANFPATNYPSGSVFFETDTGLLYVDTGSNWVYASGIQAVLQKSIPTGLGANDAGLLVDVTDFGHILRWTGSAFNWGPGDPGSGMVLGFLSNPGLGWHLCDGSTVSVLNSGGTTSKVALPNYATASYLKFGTAASAGPNAASGATTSVSAGTPSGSSTFTGASDTTGNESADTTVQSGVGATVAAQNHTHTVTPTGSVTFTGSALPTHSHGPGTIDLQNTVLLAYFRL